MGDLEVKLEQMRGEQIAQAERTERAITEMTAAIRSFESKFDSTVKWLVIAVIGSAMGSELLKIVASVVMKVSP